MGYATWHAAGVYGHASRRGPGPAWDDKTRGDKWSIALIFFVFLILPIVVALILIWLMVIAPPTPTPNCTTLPRCAETTSVKADERSTLLPTVPPALPTYITKDDGTRISCGPNQRWCWEPQP